MLTTLPKKATKDVNYNHSLRLIFMGLVVLTIASVIKSFVAVSEFLEIENKTFTTTVKTRLNNFKTEEFVYMGGEIEDEIGDEMELMQIQMNPSNNNNNIHSSDNQPKIDWADDIFKRSGWDNDPVVLESHKLLFFTVPKNACTTFKKLFRRMMGYDDWRNRSPHNPELNGLSYLGSYSREQQREFMTSPEWTRAIFVRDPVQRLLSAYMEKALGIGPPYWHPRVEGAHLKQQCCHLKGLNATAHSRTQHANSKLDFCHEFPIEPYEQPMTAENFPFEAFVERVMTRCHDVHWQPQYKRLTRGANWKHINFVGRFENKMEDTHSLLRRIGAFDDYGAFGWGERKSFNGSQSTNTAAKTKSLSIFETNTAWHSTGSGNKVDEYYTDKLLKSVVGYYRKDYDLELFNFTLPIQ